MKKLTTLLFALLFTAGMAFGQNNDATVQQTGGSGNVANVQQTYDASLGTGTNEATVKQNGSDNEVRKLAQWGASNIFDVKQVGSDNIVDSHPNQGVNQYPSYDGEIDINQYGTGNKVWDADQGGTGNLLTIDQGTQGADGNGNIVNVEAQINNPQYAGNDRPVNEIDIDQTGDYNVVGGYGDNEPGAYQQGYGNSMTIEQEGGAQAGISSHNTFSSNNPYFFRPQEGGQGLIQHGEDNLMTIHQGAGSNVVEYVLQDGTSNVATIDQLGTNSTARVSQYGTGNNADIDQQ